MPITLKGKLVHGGPGVGEAVIELEPGEIKVGSEALIRVKVTRGLSAQNDFMAVDGYGDEKAYLESDVVAVLPQEPEYCSCKYLGYYSDGHKVYCLSCKREAKPQEPEMEEIDR